MRHVLQLSLMVLALAPKLFAGTIVVLQGDTSTFGRRYFSGYSSVVKETVKAFHYSEDKAQPIIEEIAKLKPDVIVTIGILPIVKLSNLLPLTTFIVGDYAQPILEKKPNIVLINPDVPIEVAVDHFLEVYPSIQSLGAVYNPRYSKSDFERLTKHVNTRGKQVVSVKVDRPEDVGPFSVAFGKKIQALVLLKDPVLADDVATEGVFNTVRQFNWPVLSLNPVHSDHQAFLTAAIDPIALGEQAWAVTEMILRDKKIPLMAQQLFSHEIHLTLSLGALQAQKMTVSDVGLFIQKRVAEGYPVRLVK